MKTKIENANKSSHLGLVAAVCQKKQSPPGKGLLRSAPYHWERTTRAAEVRTRLPAMKASHHQKIIIPLLIRPVRARMLQPNALHTLLLIRILVTVILVHHVAEAAVVSPATVAEVAVVVAGAFGALATALAAPIAL